MPVWHPLVVQGSATRGAPWRCALNIFVFRRLAHPNLVSLFALCAVPPNVSIVMEYCSGGSLFEYIHGATFLLHFERTRFFHRGTKRMDPINALSEISVNVYPVFN